MQEMELQNVNKTDLSNKEKELAMTEIKNFDNNQSAKGDDLPPCN